MYLSVTLCVCVCTCRCMQIFLCVCRDYKFYICKIGPHLDSVLFWKYFYPTLFYFNLYQYNNRFRQIVSVWTLNNVSCWLSWIIFLLPRNMNDVSIFFNKIKINIFLKIHHFNFSSCNYIEWIHKKNLIWKCTFFL